ncbi:MAG: amidohydrolase family protein [Spirochaetales bacterium]|nr:amidohydrolase family protein [Spirochaetales bacterium]
MDMLARGKWVITDARKGAEGILEDGAVYLSGGKVVESGDYQALRKKYPKATVKGDGKQLLMPGFVDGHSHGWGLTAIQRGTMYDFLENALIDWAKMLDIDPELNAMMCAVRHLRSGCTTVHHNNWGEAPNMAEIAKKAIKGYGKVGIRFAYSPGVRNDNTLAYDDEKFFATLPPELQEFCRPMVYYDKEAVVEEFFEIFEELHSAYNDENNRIILGPSWAQGSTEEFFRRVKRRADELGKIPIHIHTLQTPHQKAYGLRKYGKSLLMRLDDLGLVDENLVLGHAVYLDERDIELLAQRRASTTHHPSCNFAVRNGISPVYYLHKAGVNVALGIDDKGINDDEDAIMELRMIYYLHRVSGFDLGNTPALSAFDVLRMGTTNAARVCGFEGEIGALEPGMKADAILVNLEEIMEDPWMSPELSIAEVFIHRAKGMHVDTAIVGGEVVMEGRKFLTVDVEELYREVRKQASKGISPQQREFAENLQRIKPYYHRYYQDWPKLDFDCFYVMNSRR